MSHERVLDTDYSAAELQLAIAAPDRIHGVVVGTLCHFDERHIPCVDFPGNGTHPLPARAAVHLTATDRGREVALLFEAGDPQRPMILGLIHQPTPLPIVAQVDEQRVVIAARQEIELRCGKSSITLTKSGKIIIRGTEILSRSSGVNRIKGGSVQIN